MADIREDKYGKIINCKEDTGGDFTLVCRMCMYHELTVSVMPCATCFSTLDLFECYQKENKNK